MIQLGIDSFAMMISAPSSGVALHPSQVLGIY